MSVLKQMNDQKPWHQPLSFEDICKNAHNWSLAGDSSLFHLMEQISQDLISKQSNIQKSLNGLQDRLSSTSTRLLNTENKFNNFANYKFTENRVYDQDVTKTEATNDATENGVAGPDKASKTREDRVIEQMPLVKEAIKLGLKLMEGEIVESQQESSAPTLSIEPYKGRRLPHLIGSDEFFNDVTLGYYNLPTASASQEIPPEPAAAPSGDVMEHDALGPLSEVNDGRDTGVVSNGLPESVHENNATLHHQPRSGDIFGPSDSDSDGDIFSEKVVETDEEEEEEDDDEEEEERPMTVADELKRRMSGQPKSKSVEKRKSKKDEPASAAQNGSMRPPLDEEDEEEDGLFSRQSLFTAGGSLFTEPVADEESDDDLFSKASKVTATPKSKTPPKSETPAANASSSTSAKSKSKPETTRAPQVFIPSSKGLFDSDDDDDDIFSSAPSQSKSAAPTGLSKSAAPIFGGSLEEDEEDDDDLFVSTGRANNTIGQSQTSSKDSTTAKSTPVTQKTPVSVPKPVSSMFSDDDDDAIFGNQKTSAPKVADPVLKGVPPLTVDTKKTVSMFSDDDDDDDLFSSMTSRSAKVVSKVETRQSEPTPVKESPHAILAREAAARRRVTPSSSSESGREPPLTTSKPPATIAPTTSKTVDPFADDDDDDDNDLFSVPTNTKPQEKKSEPEHESEPELVVEPPKKKLPPGAVPLFGAGFDPGQALRKRDLSGSSWSEREDKPEPNPTPPRATKLPPVKPPAFTMDEDDDDDDDLFASKPLKKPETKPSPVVSPPPAKTSAPTPKKDSSGFLDDYDDDEDDLFAPKPVTRVQPPLPARAASPSTSEKMNAAETSSGGWSEDESLLIKGASQPSAPAASQPIDGATADESSTDVPSSAPSQPPKPAKKAPFGGIRMMGPNLNEIKARVRHRRSESSPEPEKKSDDEEDVSRAPRIDLQSKMADPEPAPKADFSLPAKANTLTSVTKSRARIGKPRRPPTRRPGVATPTIADSSPDPIPESPKPQATSAPPLITATSEPTTTDLPETEARVSTSEDLATKIEDASTVPEKTEEVVEEKKSPVDPVPVVPDEGERSPDISPSAVPPPLDDEDDTLFGDLNIGKEQSSIADEKKEKVDEENVQIEKKAADNDYDIFASIVPKDDVKTPETKKKRTPVLLNDEDDLFASITPTASTAKVEQRNTKPATKKEEEEDDDDIFSTKPKVKDGRGSGIATDDLFADSTDIFSDIPPASSDRSKTSKTKSKTKTSTKAKSAAKAVEQDDIDDIFAPSNSLSSNGTKTKKKNSVKKTTVASKDDDIFEDPLSALK